MIVFGGPSGSLSAGCTPKRMLAYHKLFEFGAADNPNILKNGYISSKMGRYNQTATADNWNQIVCNHFYI